MAKLRKFTHSTYVEFMKFLRLKYQIITLSEALEAEPPYLILTHDVDLSLASALDMAQIEHALGIRSTYFVLFSSKIYNIFESAGNSRLRMIKFLNHEVGLHYDLKAYKQYEDFTFPLKLEVGALGMQIGQTVLSISMHQPEIEEVNPFLDVPPLICAQNPKFYDLYVSDSYRAWDKGYLEKLLSLEYDRVKLSLHPGLWTDGEVDRSTAIGKVLERSSRERDYKYMEEMLDYWSQHPKVKAYESDS